MNDGVSLGVGSVAGAVVSELLKVVIQEAKMVLTFKSVYTELASTMEDVLPIIQELEMLPGSGELKKFKDIIDEALLLVRKCSRVKRWNLPSKAKYTRKIEIINKKMLKYCQIQLQIIMLRNQRLIMNKRGWFACETVPDEVSTMPPDMLSDMPPNVPSDCLPVYAKEAIESHLKSIRKKLDFFSVSPPVYIDLCSVPKLDKVLFGLDFPLMEVKTKLLNDDDLVVSAPPGCGKTTLATQLCHDEEIKEKFEYIFFCVVSSGSTFRTIVQTLLQHSGYESPTFENDSQAVDGLRKLIVELKEDGPILLVLDDVWLGADSVLQKFQINIQDFKILVTSRFEFPSFGPIYHLKPLGDEDAKSLLIKRASPCFFRGTSRKHEDLIQKILKRCYGLPLLIEIIGVQLLRKSIDWRGEVKSWSEEETVLDVQLIRKFVNWATDKVKRWSEEETIIDNPQPNVLECLQPSLNVLDPHLKDCFLDIGSFLTQGKIRVSSIIDMWMELYGKGSESSTVYVKYLNELAFRNLLELDPARISENEDGFYDGFLDSQHSILRELAICQSKSEEHHDRGRLNLEIREDKFPDWCLDLRQPISARILSISTDDLFSSTWAEMDCPDVEALVLNISSSSYALPNFIATMNKLKVVAIINHGLGPAKLTNLSCLSSLPNLKRVIFENVSITLLDVLLSRLGSLEKLSLFMCRVGLEVSHNIDEIAIHEALPSLQEIDIDYCYDLDELPDWVSEVVSLKKLSITNCGKLSVLPKAIGNLSNLEVLRLCSCINLHELPESTERLGNLRFLDISDCLALKKLPLEIGKLQKLEKISMRMCLGCEELPDSVKNLGRLKVDCDEDTRLLWERLKPEMGFFKILMGI
ncbi:Disease resistance protein (NBS-LRR class) family [Raphanus sativus]|uniref:Probable disease resistance protein At5g66900 n=1 Tax=Raphanus sativus TaxID=3726 RepID=A0A6J0NGC3_RAPSA|nr:probable disease resistance protein At5g66900 [Raphanus sativus]KAJ4900991.1 Disease resistance protein (NBS-LRR class) family [Raphanus sativus]